MQDCSNILSNRKLPEPDIPRGPGKPKGHPKPEGSGRKRGVPNRITRDIRQAAAKYGAKALQALAKLLDDPDPKVRAAAAREILDRAYGRPATLQEVTGRGGGPIETSFPSPERSPFELAKGIAFILAKGAKDAGIELPTPDRANEGRTGHNL